MQNQRKQWQTKKNSRIDVWFVLSCLFLGSSECVFAFFFVFLIPDAKTLLTQQYFRMSTLKYIIIFGAVARHFFPPLQMFGVHNEENGNDRKWLERNRVSIAVIIICFVMNMHKLMSMSHMSFAAVLYILPNTTKHKCSQLFKLLWYANFVFMLSFYLRCI